MFTFIKDNAKLIMLGVSLFIGFALLIYVLSLRSALFRAQSEAQTYKLSAKSSIKTVQTLQESQAAIDTAILEIMSLRKEQRAYFEAQQDNLQELIESNTLVREWANEQVPQEIRDLLNSQNIQ